MLSPQKLKYAKLEVELAQQALSAEPENILQQERLSWWSAVLGDFDTAEKYAVTDKAKVHLEKCRTS